MAKFSIVLPVRNGGEYVKACVQSILHQTVSDFNLEVLENCSTDATGDWLKSLKDERIRIYPSQKPLTIEENWNRILHIPKNEYMTFIGHDDLLDNNFLEVMDKLIKKHPDAAFYQSHFRYINSKGDLIRHCKPMDEFQYTPEFLAFFLSNMSELSIGEMFKSADYDRVGGVQDYPNILYADFELWISLLGSGFRAVSSDECCSYRLHPRSTSSSSSDVNHCLAFLRLISFCIDLKEKNKGLAYIFSKYGQDFFGVNCRSLTHRLLRVPNNSRKTLTVDAFLRAYKSKMDILIGENSFVPDQIPQIRWAHWIDSNFIPRNLFYAFKKLYSRPVLGRRGN
jgi:glycosyltransferase involved in cell wall biosynthesis